MTTGSSSQDLHFLEREGQEGAEKMGVQVTIKSTMQWKGKLNVQNVVTKRWNVKVQGFRDKTLFKGPYYCHESVLLKLNEEVY